LECPNKKKDVSLVEYQTYDNELFEEENVVEEEYVEEWHVARRALKEVCVPNEHRQRECKISHCTNKGEVCSLIKEGESCASYGYIDAPTQKPSHDKDIHEDPRSLVSLPTYKNCRDSLWCDITSMDTCHTLLERPKLLDRNIMHQETSLLPSYTTQPKEDEISIVTIMKEEYHGYEEHKGLVLANSEGSKSDPSKHPILNSPMKRIFYVHPRDINLNLMVEEPTIRRSREAKAVKVGCFMLNGEGEVVKLDLETKKLHGISTFMEKVRGSKSYNAHGLLGRKMKKFIKGIYDDFKAFKKKVCDFCEEGE
jgi:hypothetical protein